MFLMHRYKIFEPILLLGNSRFSTLDIRVRVKGGGTVAKFYGMWEFIVVREVLSVGRVVSEFVNFVIAIRQAISRAIVAYYQKCMSPITSPPPSSYACSTPASSPLTPHVASRPSTLITPPSIFYYFFVILRLCLSLHHTQTSMKPKRKRSRTCWSPTIAPSSSLTPAVRSQRSSVDPVPVPSTKSPTVKHTHSVHTRVYARYVRATREERTGVCGGDGARYLRSPVCVFVVGWFSLYVRRLRQTHTLKQKNKKRNCIVIILLTTI